MFKQVVCWILSKIFPLVNHKDSFSGVVTDWDTAKAKEIESYYGGNDGTTWRFEK